MKKILRPGWTQLESGGRGALDRALAPIIPIGLVGFDEPGRKAYYSYRFSRFSINEKKPHI